MIYGSALYDLAAAESISGEVLEQLRVLTESFSLEPDFVKLLTAYHLPKAERCSVLEESFAGKVHPYVLNFLKILTERGYVRQLPDCYDAYRLRYNQEHNILPVTAVTAVCLNGEQTVRLTEKLEALTGKHIELNNRVDADVLGGVRLDFDGKCMDDTIAHRLGSIRNMLNNTIL